MKKTIDRNNDTCYNTYQKQGVINLKNFSQRGEYLWEHWNCLILQDMYLKKMWKS